MDPNESLVLVGTAEIISVFNDPNASLIRPEAIKQRDELVLKAQALEAVRGASSQQAAANIRKELSTLLKGTESERKKVKEPFLQIGKRIDGEAKKFLEPVLQEDSRIGGLISGFLVEEYKRQQAEEEKRAKELARLTSEREAAERAYAGAETNKAAEDAEARALEAERVAAEIVMAPAMETPRADGQVVRKVWKVTVNNPVALFKAFPELCEVSPKMREVNAAVALMAKNDPNTHPSLPGCSVVMEMQPIAK